MLEQQPTQLLQVQRQSLRLVLSRLQQSANLTIAVTNATTGTFTYTATGAVAGATLTLGTASCPSTIGGLYKVTSTGTFALLGTDTTTVVPTATAPGTVKATGAVYVSGLNVSQGLTRNTTDGTASVGGNATMVYYPKYHTAETAYTIKSTGVGSIVSAAAPAAGTRTYVNGVEPTAGVILTTATANASGDEQSLVLTSTVAGVQTITVTTTDSTTGVSSTVATGTITWGSVAGISAGFTSAGSFIGNGNVRPTANATTGLSYPKTAGVALAAGATTGATIAINVFDTANVAMNGQAITATIEGPGLITLASGAGTGSTGTVRAASLTATTQAATHQSVLGISADGTAGKATITVSSGTTVLSTKTVIFYGTVAKLSCNTES
jgi:hypothetical protein